MSIHVSAAINEGGTYQVYNKSICQILHAYCTCNVEIMLMFDHTHHYSCNIFSTFVALSSAVALLLTHFNAEWNFALSSNWCADIFALFNPCFVWSKLIKLGQHKQFLMSVLIKRSWLNIRSTAALEWGNESAAPFNFVKFGYAGVPSLFNVESWAFQNKVVSLMSLCSPFNPNCLHSKSARLTSHPQSILGMFALLPQVWEESFSTNLLVE